MLFLLVIAAWGSLFVPMPKWLSMIVSIAVTGIGFVFLLFGSFGAYWDSHMRPDSSAAMPMLFTAILMLLSRAVLILKLIAEVLSAPPSN